MTSFFQACKCFHKGIQHDLNEIIINQTFGNIIQSCGIYVRSINQRLSSHANDLKYNISTTYKFETCKNHTYFGFTNFHGFREGQIPTFLLQ